jgi:hypothetical protein
MHNKLNALEIEVAALTEQHQSSETAPQAETDRTIEFLQGEMSKHREFIESERSFLVWMLGVIISIGGIILGFFGFKTKKDVEGMVKTRYNDTINLIVQDRVDALIDGQKNKRYLDKSLKAEKHAASKSICFIEQKGSGAFDKVLPVFKKFFGEDSSVQNKVVKATDELLTSDNNLSTLVNAYDIIIFEVPKSEDGKDEKNPDFLYRKLDAACSNTNTQCILYCRDLKVNIGEINGDVTTTVQFISKLKETLFATLYWID